MAEFRKVKGKTMWHSLPVTPSTVLAAGSLVAFSGGKLVAATATTLPGELVGVLRKGIAATDADYALDRLVEVEVPVERNVVWEFETVGAAATDIGVEVDLVDADTVDVSASAIKIAKVLKVLSATKCQGLLKIGGAY